ncbi:MAG TPA: hypothetical protein VFD43_01525, partial [Planctomycetota bacterium]|nr:hypothetical protein [Planctomycetota bacterium]
MSPLRPAAAALLALAACCLAAARTAAQARPGFEFHEGDRVCLLGGALAERLQHHGWLETRLQSRLPELGLSFRNLGFAGDELAVQLRTDGFGSWDDHLSHCRA